MLGKSGPSLLYRVPLTMTWVSTTCQLVSFMTPTATFSIKMAMMSLADTTIQEICTFQERKTNIFLRIKTMIMAMIILRMTT